MLIRCFIFLASLFVPCNMAAQSVIPLQKYAAFSPATSSVLSTGKWFKMKIYHNGLYCLTYEDIHSMGFTDPGQVRIFGNGGSMVPLVNNTLRYDDLLENALYMNSGSDGIFNQGDYILFYGRGPVTWDYQPLSGMFEYQMHEYSNASFYFVTTDAGIGKKISARSEVIGIPSADISAFDDYSYHEVNLYNLIESGRQWFGERVDYDSYDTTFVFTHRIPTSIVKVKINVVSRSENVKTFTLMNGDNMVGTINVPSVVLNNSTGVYANQKSAVFGFTVSGDDVPLELSYNRYSSDDLAYLDYITVNARRSLSLVNHILMFRDQEHAESATLARYSVDNCTENTQIWDVTDPFNIQKMSASLSGNTLTFNDSTLVLKEYIAFDPGTTFEKPEINTTIEGVGIISNQNLHNTQPHEMLIVSHPLFTAVADSIANLHRQRDHISVITASTEQIYNEFSSGAPDVSAIRDYARLIYNRATNDNDRLKYLLLIGDGSYNNLSSKEGNVNYILTYQSESSLNASSSYVSDDFYGFMEDTEGGTENMEDYSLDLGVGRLPVKTTDEAQAMFNKIKHYNTYVQKGDWQNNILFAADDGDGNLHMTQANELADWVDNHYPQFAIRKVLIDAYPQVSSSSGARYPEAKNAIVQGIEKGLLIFNYTGHGGELGLADEQILMREDLQNLSNIDHLPLFITATCEFSRFDDLTKDEEGNLKESTSAGEYSLLNPDGGSIALLTTTRIVYSSENHDLNTRFYEVAFTRDASGNRYALGDLAKMTKNLLGNSRNKLNFILLGDPALKLAVPDYSIITDSINHVALSDPLDTLKAFSHITISGHIEDPDNQLAEHFNGIIQPSVFDKKKTVTTLANDYSASPMQFTTREDLLFKGKASVANGKFTFEFTVPKDITYSYGYGKINYYAWNQETDANGQISSFLIGGTNTSNNPDLEGPDIELYMNDELFKSKGITSPNPVIYAKISDVSGINTIGNGIGHDITGIVDEEVSDPIIMNDYFETNLDDYTSGILTYPMYDLSEGIHSLKVKVWDVYNNSSEQTIQFNVIDKEGPFIAGVINYPNPASDYTTFLFEHNKADEELIVTITVYDLTGRMVYNFSSDVITSGYNTKLDEWDLRDYNGNKIKQGIYPYRIRATDSNGSYSDSYQKLVVIR
jgi:hypothetical protein